MSDDRAHLDVRRAAVDGAAGGRAGRGHGARRRRSPSTATPGGPRSARSPPAGPGTSTRGPRSATTAATRSSATPTTGSATTVASTPCGPTGGGARATCAGREPTNRGFLRALAGLGAMADGDRRGRRGRADRPVPRPARPRRPAARRDRRPARAVRRPEPPDGHRQGVRRGRRRGDGRAGGRGAGGGRVRAGLLVGGDGALLARLGLADGGRPAARRRDPAAAC